MLLIPMGEVNPGIGARLLSVSQAGPGWHSARGCSPAPQEGLQGQSSKWMARGRGAQMGLSSRHQPR